MLTRHLQCTMLFLRCFGHNCEVKRQLAATAWGLYLLSRSPSCPAPPPIDPKPKKQKTKPAGPCVPHKPCKNNTLDVAIPNLFLLAQLENRGSRKTNGPTETCSCSFQPPTCKKKLVFVIRPRKKQLFETKCISSPAPQHHHSASMSGTSQCGTQNKASCADTRYLPLPRFWDSMQRRIQCSMFLARTQPQDHVVATLVTT